MLGQIGLALGIVAMLVVVLLMLVWFIGGMDND